MIVNRQKPEVGMALALCGTLWTFAACTFDLPPLNSSTVGEAAGAGAGGTGMDGSADVAETVIDGSAGAEAGFSGSTTTPPWWDAEWEERWPIVVNNLAQNPLDDGFQLALPIDYDSKPASPSLAWRVAWWNGIGWTEVPRIIEQVGTTTWVWFASEAPIVGGATEDGYFLYTNNLNAKEPTFAAEVFAFHSFFDVQDLVSCEEFGHVAYANGQIELEGSGEGASIGSHKVFGPRIVSTLR